MDGTGKTNLVKQLQDWTSLPIHARAADSVIGPRADLFEWAAHDVYSMPTQPLAIYDRHCMISEYIYGPIVRNRIDPRFLGYRGSQMSKLFVQRTLVIHCDPGMDEVSKNLRYSAAVQMDGVNANADTLYHTYASFMHYWPGHRVVWDYTKPDTFSVVISTIENHIFDWREAHNA
jgi:hypothetical protein